MWYGMFVYTQMSIWKSSSSSSSRSLHIVRMHMECSCCVKSMCLCHDAVLDGNGVSTAQLLPSLEVLKVSQQHTGLWCDWVVLMLHGVTGSKGDVFITQNIVDSQCSSKRSGYVKIFTTTLISFIF